MADPKGKSEASGAEPSVPKSVVSRLSLYLRELQHLMRDGQETTSSTQLGKLLGFTDAQVRKVAFAVDPTYDVAREVVEWGADLLVVHHPLFL